MPVVDMKGKKLKDMELSADVFAEDRINNSLIHEYVVMYLANQRQSGANTKTRGEVRRSGRKLYRQKGSGRARVGDAGSPIRRSGGVAMGPRSERNWSKSMPAKMRKGALASSLSLKAQGGALTSLDAYTSRQMKTKEALAMLTALQLDTTKTLVVLPVYDELLEKSLRNIRHVRWTTAGQLNAYEVMCTKHILFVADAFTHVEGRLIK